MTNAHIVEESIKHSIRKNGFPEKIVKLPFKPVYKNCREKGVPLADVLKNLKADGIVSTIEGNHILFASPEKVAAASQSSQEKTADPENISWMNAISSPAAMKNLIQSNLFKLDPSRIKELRELAETLSDDDKKSLMEMLSKISKPLSEK